MKEKIKPILEKFQSGEINIHEALKQLNDIYPPFPELYDKAREMPYTIFVKYLKNYGEQEQ